MWAFTEPPKYGVSTNPTQGEHFINDRVDRNDTLVRESGQNTNDARQAGAPVVELRITLLRGDESPSAEALAPYLTELIPHLEASGVETEAIDLAHPSLLLVEDFGTVGLQGATDKDDGESLSLFWRNVGESHKGGSRGGRWGLGKTVFANSSRLSTWFALTIRVDDPKPLVIGQIALRKHKIGETFYQPHALYCASRPGEFERPIDDPAETSNFSSTFRLSRTTEPGLSVVIPFPHETITESNLLKAAIQHFFFPIIRGRMIIKINGRTLTASTIESLAAELDCSDLPTMKAAIKVAEEICAADATSMLSVDNPDALNFPNGPLAASAFTEESLADLKRSYQRGDLLSLKVPITIFPKRIDPIRSHIKLYLKHVASLEKGQDFYLRDGISVIEHRSFGEAEKAIGILLADDETVSRFLGDAENPAHTAWNAKASGLESRYRNPQKTVMFIRRILRQFFDVVAKEEGVEDPNALLDVFFVRQEDQASGPGPKAAGEAPPPPPPPPTPPPRLQKLVLSQIKGGFTIKGGKDLTKSDLPMKVIVKAAYEVRRGNPFNKYDTSDF